MLGQMALRQIRQMSPAEETFNDRRGSCAASRRHHAEKKSMARSRPPRNRLHSSIDGSAKLNVIRESTRLQYALVDCAIHFGWPRETVVVIDDDLVRSGSTIESRFGFQRLVAEVGLGNVGPVLRVDRCRAWRARVVTGISRWKFVPCSIR